MAVGLGAFLGGVGQGYVASKQMQREEAREARENERLGIEKERAKRDAEDFGLRKQLTEQQIASGKLDMEKRQRDAEYEKELSTRLKELTSLTQPGIEGDVIDTSGKSSGMRRFSSLEAANQELGTSGLTFRPGSVKEAAPMDPIDFQLKAADVMKDVALKYGKVDLNMLKASRDFGRQIRQEGAIDAMKYFLTTQDQKGAKAMFNKRGGITLGDDIQLGLKDGMFGPTVVGYKVGPKGEKVEVFDGFRDIILPSMSPEAYSQTVAQFKMTETKEKGENVRLGAQLASAERIAATKAQADKDVARAATDKDDRKALIDIHKTRFAGIFRNPQDVLESNRQKAIEGRILSLAEEYLNTGKVGPGQAYDLAQQQVFRDFKVQTSELAK